MSKVDIIPHYNRALVASPYFVILACGTGEKKQKLSEKELEQELTNLLTEPWNDANSAQKIARVQSITAFLLLKSSRKVEQASWALTGLSVVLAATMISFALIIASFLGYISF